jgi:hypothetical protein
LATETLLRAAEFYKFAAHVETEFSGFGGGDDLEGHGALDFGVALRSGLEDFVGAEVEDDEFVAFEEAKAVGAGLEGLAADLEWDFGEEIGLVFLAEAGRVAGIVDHAREHINAVGKLDAAGVAHLDWSGLAAEEDGFREELGRQVRGLEDDVFAISRACQSRCGVPESWDEDQKRGDREKRKTTKHGVSFELKGEMLDEPGSGGKYGRHIARLSGAFFDGIPFFNPIGGEAARKEQDAEMDEAHLVQSREGGAKVGAAVQWATAAVDDDICVFGKRGGKFPEVGDALIGGAGAVERGAWDVSTRVERADADVDDFERWIGLGLQFLGEIGRRDDLGGGPRWSGVGWGWLGQSQAKGYEACDAQEL